ncbi:ABC-F family ATP-binding cassette domain-containing protein [Roseburia sp. MSJ-14]|uniref:ABC-F family ATP-binding cassette domain-containing protein n=1 Tax=Roseburia sp. MSJ-14 TaxID=2841514 RepID=UPI001C0F592B|nr:ABC-F family ATP-binding cassette domain-containing protein [Roseburia sp. MSJ-14]MBU5472696.1 ABC-F family ATP-binding cassette domain-containing protein [Roseburia sp. MSJ-14]
MILACQNISKSFGTDEIIQHASFHVEAYEKAAIVGINGAGKTTLLRIIMGEIPADQGEVVLAKDKTIGYLPQNPDVSGNHTIYEEVLSAKEALISMEEKLRDMESKMNQYQGQELEDFMESYNRLNHEFELQGGYSYQSEIVGVLKGLGFSEEEFGKHMQELSGGQRTRVCLGKLLVTKPDVILLDEPTNHLDINSIAWLETFLLNYKGAVVIVSHDRYFLDKVVSKVIELDRTKVSVFQGNYSDYAQKRAQVREAQLKQYYNQQREIKHQEEVIAKLKSFNREKSIKRAESREKMLDKIERLEKPTEENTDIHLHLEPRIVSGNDVLSVEHLAKAYPNQQLFSDISFEIKRGERVALIGDNGTGKTTILKIINDMIEADGGVVKLGTNVNIGYYDQEHQVLHKEKNLMEEISDAYPNLTNTEIRNVLAAFLFTGDEVFKQIADLSGGEKGRVSLAKLMLSEANFLILDEPTNHLDITSKEILEQALNSYTGTVLFVSHDRYFINKTATRILNLTGETIVNYIGNYDYYMEKCKELTQIYVGKKENEVKAETESSNKLDWKQQKEEQARLRKIENERKRTEEKIEELETHISELEESFSKEEIATNSTKLQEVHEEYAKCQQELEALYEKWETLM